MNMTPDECARLLSRLQSEFPISDAWIAELEGNLATGVAGARKFGNLHRATMAWDALWQQRWDDVARYLQRIHLLLREMEQYTRSSSPDLLQAAMEAWEEMQAEHVQLTAALNAIQQQAITLDAAVRTDWNAVVQSVEPHLVRLHTFATALRIRLELLRSNSREGADSLVSHLLATLPGHGSVHEKDPQVQLPSVGGPTEPEPAEPEGFMDIVKTLLMWVDPPVNRPNGNSPACGDETAPPPPPSESWGQQ